MKTACCPICGTEYENNTEICVECGSVLANLPIDVISDAVVQGTQNQTQLVVEPKPEPEIPDWLKATKERRRKSSNSQQINMNTFLDTLFEPIAENSDVQAVQNSERDASCENQLQDDAFLDFSIYRPADKCGNPPQVGSKLILTEIESADFEAVIQITSEHGEFSQACLDHSNCVADDFSKVDADTADALMISVSARKWDDDPKPSVPEQELKEKSTSDSIISEENLIADLLKDHQASSVPEDDSSFNLNRAGECVETADNTLIIEISTDDFTQDEIERLMNPTEAELELIIDNLSPELKEDEPDLALSETVSDSTDEIPWNLFDTDEELTLPAILMNRVLRPFSKPAFSTMESSPPQITIASTLEKLFKAESGNFGRSKNSTKFGRSSTRLLSLIAVLAVVLLILLFPKGFVDLIPAYRSDTPNQAAVNRFIVQIETLSAGQNALIVLDASPGRFLELKTATDILITKLSEIGVNLRFVTTNPSALPVNALYTQSKRFDSGVDLGFLPGNALAVRQLTYGMRDDITAIFLITANFENTKVWIEQNQSVNPGTALYILSATESGALLHPYLTSQGVDGGIFSAAEREIFSARYGSTVPLEKSVALYVLIFAAFVFYAFGLIKKRKFGTR